MDIKGAFRATVSVSADVVARDAPAIFLAIKLSLTQSASIDLNSLDESKHIA